MEALSEAGTLNGISAISGTAKEFGGCMECSSGVFMADGSCGSLWRCEVSLSTWESCETFAAKLPIEASKQIGFLKEVFFFGK